MGGEWLAVSLRRLVFLQHPKLVIALITIRAQMRVVFQESWMMNKYCRKAGKYNTVHVQIYQTQRNPCPYPLIFTLLVYYKST